MAISKAHPSLSCNIKDIEKKSCIRPFILIWTEICAINEYDNKNNSYVGHLKKAVYHNVSSSY